MEIALLADIPGRLKLIGLGDGTIATVTDEWYDDPAHRDFLTLRTVRLPNDPGPQVHLPVSGSVITVLVECGTVVIPPDLYLRAGYAPSLRTWVCGEVRRWAKWEGERWNG